MDVLSEEDFRANLYTSMQKKGMLNKLKSQLRCSLAKELQSSINGDGDDRGLPLHHASLNHQIAQYLIIEYLRHHNYQYTLSTLLPEAGIDLNKLLSCDDVIRVLGVKAQISEINESHGLLLYLLHDISCLNITDRTTCGVQTDEVTFDTSDGRGQAFEKRMLSFQRDCEKRIRSTYDLEMARFKENELVMMRLEEKNNYLKQLTQARDQLDRDYQNKLSLVTKEIDSDKEKLKKKEAEMEQMLFIQRQNLLNEMESLKLRESKLLKQAEFDKKAVSLEKEKASSLQKILTDKEEVLCDLRLQYEEMFKAKLEKYKAEIDTTALSNDNQLTLLKSKLEVQEHAMSELNNKHVELLAKLREEEVKMKELHEQLQSATQSQTALLKEKEDLQDKVNQMRLKGRHIQIHDMPPSSHDEDDRETLLKEKLSEQEITIKELKEKIDTLSRSKSSTQQKFEKHLKRSSEDITSLQRHQSHLKEDITNKARIITCLQEKLNSMTIEVHSLRSINADLNEQVDALHSILTGNKSKEKSKHQNISRNKSGQHVSVRSLPPLSSPPSLGGGNDSILTASSSPFCLSFSDSSAQLLAEARATFARMEKESEVLAKAYNIYPSYQPPPGQPHLYRSPAITQVPHFLSASLQPQPHPLSTQPHPLVTQPHPLSPDVMPHPSLDVSTTHIIPVTLSVIQSVSKLTTPVDTIVTTPPLMSTTIAPALETTPPSSVVTVPITSSATFQNIKLDLDSYWVSHKGNELTSITTATVAMTKTTPIALVTVATTRTTPITMVTVAATRTTSGHVEHEIEEKEREINEISEDHMSKAKGEEIEKEEGEEPLMTESDREDNSHMLMQQYLSLLQTQPPPLPFSYRGNDDHHGDMDRHSNINHQYFEHERLSIPSSDHHSPNKDDDVDPFEDW
jgi:oral-facial-digital syndrome 1 protein